MMKSKSAGRVKTMKDKSLEISLIVIFGITGLAITALAWSWPAMESERIMATLAGLAGISIALFKYAGLRKMIRRDVERVPVRVEARDKQ
jgi:hypothetical protein